MPGRPGSPRIGVLAIQGDVAEHLRLLRAVGAEAVAVQRPAELATVEGLIIPGGESTTIGKMLVRYELFDPVVEALRAGLPVLGTCAGAILLSSRALLADGRPSSQRLLGVVDATTRRNAFGRQVASFEGPVDVKGVGGGPLHGVFIRAPWFEQHGPGVEVLASVATPLGDRVVVVQQGNALACAFHPELTGDDRLHRRLISLVTRADRDASGGAPASSS